MNKNNLIKLAVVLVIAGIGVIAKIGIKGWVDENKSESGEVVKKDSVNKGIEALEEKTDKIADEILLEIQVVGSWKKEDENTIITFTDNGEYQAVFVANVSNEVDQQDGDKAKINVTYEYSITGAWSISSGKLKVISSDRAQRILKPLELKSDSLLAKIGKNDFEKKRSELERKLIDLNVPGLDWDLGESEYEIAELKNSSLVLKRGDLVETFTKLDSKN